METTRLLTIREAASVTGLSAHTLRFYERIGLLDHIARGSDGHRRYREDDLDWINLLVCLRKGGMPIRGMLDYAELLRGGDPDGRRRRVLLEAQRRDALARIEEIRESIAFIDYKLALLDELQRERERAAPVEALVTGRD